MVADKSYLECFILFFLSAAICTHSISEARRCSDQLCKEPISEAKVIADFIAASDNQLSLTKDDIVTVYSKESGSDPELWAGEVNGKTGYFPKAYVQETKVFNKNPSFIVATETQGRDETQQNIKSTADNSESGVASGAAGTEQSDPAPKSETDGKSVTQLVESTAVNKQEKDSKQTEGEVENGKPEESNGNGKPEESNGNGETAGMMSSIVNKVTDFFNAPDEDDEGEFPQLSSFDTSKPDDAVSTGKAETAIKENVVDFSHLVDEGSLGMGLEDGSLDSNRVNNNGNEKGQKEVEPVKPPPLDFISKETKEEARAARSTESRGEASDHQNGKIDEDGNFEDAITQGVSSSDVRDFQKSREEDQAEKLKDLNDYQKLSETTNENILYQEFEQLNNLKKELENIQKLKEIEERMKPVEEQHFVPTAEEINLRRKILNVEQRLKKKVNDPDFRKQKDKDLERVETNKMKKQEGEKVKKVESQNLEEEKKRLEQDSLRKEEERRSRVENEQLKLEAKKQEEDRIKVEEIRRIEKLKKEEEERKIKEEYRKQQEEKERLELDRLRMEEERKKAEEKRLKLETKKREEERIKSEELRRIKEEILKREKEEIQRQQELIRKKQLEKQKEEERKALEESRRREEEDISQRLKEQKRKTEEERIAKEKIKEEERKKRIDEAVARRLKLVEEKYQQEQKEAEERRKEMEKEEQEIERQFKEKLESMVPSQSRKEEIRNQDPLTKEEKQHTDVVLDEIPGKQVHNRRSVEENKKQKSFPPLSDYTLHLEPSVCNSVNPRNRRDCGVDTKEECHQEGCCWSPTGSVRCFFAPSFVDAEKAYNKAMYAKLKEEEEDSVYYTNTKSKNTKLYEQKDYAQQTFQTSLATKQEVPKSDITTTSSIETSVQGISGIKDSPVTNSHFTSSISTTTDIYATINPSSTGSTSTIADKSTATSASSTTIESTASVVSIATSASSTTSASAVADKSTVMNASSATSESTTSVVSTATSASSTTSESTTSVVSTATSATSTPSESTTSVVSTATSATSTPSESTTSVVSTATSASSTTIVSSSTTVSEDEKVLAVYKSTSTATAATMKNISGNGENVHNSIPKQELNSENLTKDVPVVTNATEMESDIKVQVRDDGFISTENTKETNTAKVLKGDASQTVLSPEASDHETHNHSKTGKFTEFLRSFRSFHDNSAERIISLWQSTRSAINGIFGFLGFGQVLDDFEKMHPMVVPVSLLVGSLGLFYVLGACCGGRRTAAHGVSAHDQLRTFEARIKILEDERDETIAKKDEMEEQFKEAKKKQLASDEAASSAHRNLEKLIKKVQRSEDEKTRLSATIEQLQVEIESLKISCNQRDVQMEKLQSVIEEKESILRDKYDEITEIEEALKEKDQTRDALEEQFASIETQLRESGEKSAQMQEQLETWEKKYDEVQLSLDEYAMRNSQLQEQLDFRTTEVGVLQDCLMQIKESDAPQDQNGDDLTDEAEDEERDKKKAEQLHSLMNAAKAKAELRIVTEEKEKFEKNYYVNKHRREELEEQLKEFEQEMLKLKTAEEQARVEAKELEIKYDTMRNYFKEAEVDLHRKLTSEEAARLASQNQLKVELGKASTAVQDLDKYRRQYGELKEEIAKLRENFRSQLADVEERAHENWLKFRTSERELEEIKRERDGLRRRVFEMEKEKTRPSSSQGQINHVEALEARKTPPGGGRVPPGAPFPAAPPGHQSPAPIPPLVRMRGPPVPPMPCPVPPFSHTPPPQPGRYGFPPLDGREVDARPPSRGSRHSNTPPPSDTSYSIQDGTTNFARLPNSTSTPQNSRQPLSQPDRKISDNKRPPSGGERDGAVPRPPLTGPTVPPPGAIPMFAPRGPFPHSMGQPHLGPPSMAPPPVMGMPPPGLSHGPPRGPPPAGLNNFRRTGPIGRKAGSEPIQASDSFQMTPSRGK